MATLETNASMGLIVASPTAGSAGIVPGLMLAMQEHYQFSDEEIIQALFNASAIGYLAMRNATVAGAVGGCQAEVGVASAMAASAAVELMGGTPRKCTFAASTVLMNMLGLVCDPVGGLVEYPCQNRNAAGVANAIIAAEMALAGIPQLIPLDEMIQTMFTVGKKLPAELRETAMAAVLLRHLHVRHAIFTDLTFNLDTNLGDINVLNADAHNGAVWFHTVLFLFYLKKSYIKNGESIAFSVKLK